MNTGSLVGYHEVVGTLKPYLMQKTLFLLFVLKEVVGIQKRDGGDVAANAGQW